MKALKEFDGGIFRRFEDYVKTLFETFHFQGNILWTD